jgi:acylphosphatase
MFSRELRITGYVQGVGFRNYVYVTALANNVKGEVWNGVDQAVYVLAQHEDEATLKRFIEEMWTGPGRVDQVQAVDATRADRADFQIGLTR